MTLDDPCRGGVGKLESREVDTEDMGLVEQGSSPSSLSKLSWKQNFVSGEWNNLEWKHWNKIKVQVEEDDFLNLFYVKKKTLKASYDLCFNFKAFL